MLRDDSKDEAARLLAAYVEAVKVHNAAAQTMADVAGHTDQGSFAEALAEVEKARQNTRKAHRELLAYRDWIKAQKQEAG